MEISQEPADDPDTPDDVLPQHFLDMNNYVEVELEVS